MVGAILFETLNARLVSQKFLQLTETMKNGQISLPDFVIQIQAWEFNNNKLHHVIAKQAFDNNEWKIGADLYNYELKVGDEKIKIYDMTLGQLLNFNWADDHGANHVTHWFRVGADMWMKKNPNDMSFGTDPQLPFVIELFRNKQARKNFYDMVARAVKEK